jgi:hypothetical protein
LATDRLASSALGLLLAACVANDRSDRPPLVPPAPPQSVINTVGFDDAMRVGSDYIYASKLPDRVFLGAQELPGNLWLLRFGPGASGGPPVDLYIDAASGKVVREEPADAELKLVPVPAPPAPVPAPPPVPVAPPPPPK